ncbi:T9SS type A sorting domain-containing protein [Zunongwangia sp. F363]|uniref:T9SS type A sorting domain-containing protein n=1 Tax=Autumnicola tepida TaxID=3075595 RepID=A0ABU3CEW5_9FLAO|nr:T9SS type A sorting domain-containing protein [Zunongwangia sp. F363]MDT0644788.1 T9SS type A sorting domain-containing protein [Zunongwangia sp. F363]
MMRSIITITLFTCAFNCLAQLSISPSAVGDSYVYVSDQLLYVHDGIQLVKNRNPSTEASIYLREEAQLLQGEKPGNLNQGNGAISVFQEGTSNAFDFNYWSLPVSNPSAGKNISEYILEPQDLTRSKKAIFTSELNGLAEPLTISKKWIYKFAGDDYADWKYIGDFFDLKPGEGFTMKGTNGLNHTLINGIENNPGSSQRYDFRGTANDGLFNIRILENQSLLVGNPYPSALHLKIFLLENPATTGIAYFWDSKDNGTSHYLKDYEGGYGAYSPGANCYVPAVFKKYRGNGELAGVTGENGEIIPREFIPVAQGFMLIGSKDGNVTFKNSHRIFKKEKTQDARFKAAAKDPEVSEIIPNLRLDIEINNLYSRPLVLAFRDDATTGKDWAMDAMAMNNISSDIGWLIDSNYYIINVRPFSAEEKIPFIVNMAADGEITFSLESMRALEPEAIFVHDAEANIYKDIMNEKFRVMLPKGEFSQRFFLSLKMPVPEQPKIDTDSTPNILAEEVPLTIEKTTITSPEEIMVSQDNQEEILRVKIPAKILAEQLNLFDLKGSKVLSRKISNTEKEIYLSTRGLSQGVYILNLITTDQKKISKKITVRKGL